ncbi:hypothetical protein IFO70_07465 [Phormidium tenue FACHB-886]|nr:hypothetical protein [Phormidium tenue FACHB-886]
MKTASHYSVDFFKVSEPVPTKPPVKKQSFGSLLGKVWQFLNSTDLEPKVQQKFDRFGYSYWRAFDPLTSQTKYFETEDEVCQWLEKRYYPQG